MGRAGGDDVGRAVVVGRSGGWPSTRVGRTLSALEGGLEHRGVRGMKGGPFGAVRGQTVTESPLSLATAG